MITALDGDQVNKRGAITGGFTETSKSRISAMKRVKEAQSTIASLNQELVDHQKTAEELDADIASILSNMQKAQSDIRMMKQQALDKKDDMEKDKQTIGFGAGNLEAKGELLASVQKNVRDLGKDRDIMQAELKSKMVDKLSSAEQKELQGVIHQQTELTKQLPAVRQQRADLEAQKKALTARLDQHLKKREEELSSQLAAVGSGDSLGSLSQSDSQDVDLELSEGTIERLETELEQVKAQESKLREEERQHDDARAAITKQLAADKKDLDKVQKEEGSDRRTQVEKQLESVHQSKGAQLAKKEAAMKKIRDLGSLPADAFEKYSETSVADCMKKLKKVNEKLKKFDGVNKKALDQFMSFTEQRDDLQSRMEELDTAKESITKLINVLDQRKDEAIQRTFKGVSQHFTSIFKDVVPQGKATLVMLKKKKKKKKAEEGDDDSEEDEVSSRNLPLLV